MGKVTRVTAAKVLKKRLKRQPQSDLEKCETAFPIIIITAFSGAMAVISDEGIGELVRSYRKNSGAFIVSRLWVKGLKIL
ncbi:hypothetical protein [Moorena sp. SIO4G3]|uniref:hypothetical protein n=1 Tax=Moorena sp. SIO4G3 TaxID=2607821 RepID=UPI00142BBFE0|nr:hypothetical protein [Moorena sp. SIO4G3]NEO81682.1 hypothetical protein [Moorena sp. SIO4G3]